VAAGRDDIEMAVAMEPQRAVLRSYLGKADSLAGRQEQALKELKLAEAIDANDPTSWLYSALLKQQLNRINEAANDLEESLKRNDNRRIYRSQLLLDQDRAVRGANLASIYQDAGLFDVSVREAQGAVSADYANYSGHLFWRTATICSVIRAE
jgi:tetratricopeptide (TPR) repeat protein